MTRGLISVAALVIGAGVAQAGAGDNALLADHLAAAKPVSEIAAPAQLVAQVKKPLEVETLAHTRVGVAKTDAAAGATRPKIGKPTDV